MDKSQVRFLKMAVPLGGLFMASRMDQTDPSHVLLVRFIFGSFVLMTAGILWHLRQQILKADNQTIIQVPEKQLPSFGTPKPVVEKKPMKTVDYELQEWKTAFNGLLSGTVIVSLVHWYFGIFPPLIISGAQNIVGMVTSPLFEAYALGREVKRPFKPEEGMFDSLKNEWKDLKKVVKEGKVPEEGDRAGAGEDAASDPKAERRRAILQARKEAKKNKAA